MHNNELLMAKVKITEFYKKNKIGLSYLLSFIQQVIDKS